MPQNRTRNPQGNDPAPVVPPTPEATDDGPDLGPAPEAAAVVIPEGSLVVSPDELQAMVAQAVQDATLPLQQAARATTVNVVAAQGTIPHNPHDAPAEPTYEPAFIPTAEDWLDYNAAVARGEVVDEPIPLEATIMVVGPRGDHVECTPKVFRTVMASKGYKAHPEDAARHLGGERRTRRRRSDGVATTEQAVAQGRRRRRTEQE